MLTAARRRHSSAPTRRFAVAILTSFLWYAQAFVAISPSPRAQAPLPQAPTTASSYAASGFAPDPCRARAPFSPTLPRVHPGLHAGSGPHDHLHRLPQLPSPVVILDATPCSASSPPPYLITPTLAAAHPLRLSPSHSRIYTREDTEHEDISVRGEYHEEVRKGMGMCQGRLVGVGEEVKQEAIGLGLLPLANCMLLLSARYP